MSGIDLVRELPFGMATAALTSLLAVLSVLVYYSTGAPAARFALYDVAAQRVRDLNGGPVRFRQRAGEFLGEVIKVRPSILRSAGVIEWAHSVEQAAAMCETAQDRENVYALLAQLAGDPSVVQRLKTREGSFVESVVPLHELPMATTLGELRAAVTQSDRSRRLSLLRNGRRHVDFGAIGPVVTRSLDFVGRGVTFGLLVGVVLSNGHPMDYVVNAVGVASLFGGALGALLFAGQLAQRLTVGRRGGGEQTRTQEFMQQHPYGTIALLWGIVAVILTLLRLISKG